MVEINNLVNQAVADATKRRQQTSASQISLSDQQAQKVKGGASGFNVDLPIILGMIIDETKEFFDYFDR